MSDVDSSNIMVHSDLEQAGSTINGMAQTIADELNTLIQQLAPLPDIWTGPASGYYEGLQNEWNYAADGLFGPNGVLGQIAHAMHVVWNNYAEAEWANVNTWKTY
jgi:WXG100 family type VII secretion target